MNRIFTVIWSGVRGGYVAVPEYHVMKGKSKTVKMVRAFMLAGAVISGAMTSAYADNYIGTDNFHYEGVGGYDGFLGDRISSGQELSYSGSFYLDYVYGESQFVSYPGALFYAEDGGMLNLGTKEGSLSGFEIRTDGVPGGGVYPYAYVIGAGTQGSVNLYAANGKITVNMPQKRAAFSVLNNPDTVDIAGTLALSVESDGLAGQAPMGSVIGTERESHIRAGSDISASIDEKGTAGGSLAVVKVAAAGGDLALESLNGTVALSLRVNDALFNTMRAVENSNRGNLAILGHGGIRITSETANATSGSYTYTYGIENNGSLKLESATGDIAVAATGNKLGDAIVNYKGGDLTVKAWQGTFRAQAGAFGSQSDSVEHTALSNYGTMNISAGNIALQARETTGSAIGLYQSGNNMSSSTLDSSGQIAVSANSESSSATGVFTASSSSDSVSLSGRTVAVSAEAGTQAIAMRLQGSGAVSFSAQDDITVMAKGGTNGAFGLYAIGGDVRFSGGQERASGLMIVSEATGGNALNHTAAHVVFDNDFTRIASKSDQSAVGLRVQDGDVAFNGSQVVVGAQGETSATALSVSGSGVSAGFAGNTGITALSAEGAAHGVEVLDGATVRFSKPADMAVSGETEAIGLYARQASVAYAGGNIDVVSGQDEAIGLFAGEGANLSLSGDTVVNALTALKGTGNVSVEDGAMAVLDGAVRDFSGHLNVKGYLAVGMDRNTAGQLAAREGAGKSVMVLKAGTGLSGAAIGIGHPATAGSSGNGNASILLNGDGVIHVLLDDGFASPALIAADLDDSSDGGLVRVSGVKPEHDGTLVFRSLDKGDFAVVTDNLLVGVDREKDRNVLTMQKASEVLEGLIAPSVMDEALQGGSASEAGKRVFGMTQNTDAASAVKALNKIALMGTAGAAQVVSVNTAGMLADTIERHGSRLSAYDHCQKGADLWIDLNGNFSKANRYGAGNTRYGYKSDMAGATVGMDRAFGNGFTAGAALSFGTGTARGQGNGAGTHNEIDYWGFNLYGVYTHDKFNLIGHAGYLETSNEISQLGYKGEADVKTLSAGLRVEKPFAVSDTLTVMPHIGLRYLHVDMDSFSAGGFRYGADNADLVQTPFGVALTANLKTGNGMPIKPFIDLTVAPAFGDRKADNRFGLEGGRVSETLSTRIAGDTLYMARAGVEASHRNHRFGLNVGVGSGDDGRVDQEFMARYRYSF